VGWLVAALVLGVLSNLEGLAISLIMPVWRHDVKTLAMAWRLRGIARARGSRLIPKITGIAVLMFLVAARPLIGQESGEAIYETGTSQITANTAAPMIATAEGLRFEAAMPVVISLREDCKGRVPQGRAGAPWILSGNVRGNVVCSDSYLPYRSELRRRRPEEACRGISSHER
jgi:hypothetical protein